MDGLEFIHSKGICHLDVKVDNAMLTDKGNVKLIDFGLSDFFSNEVNLKDVKGSPQYVAP